MGPERVLSFLSMFYNSTTYLRGFSSFLSMFYNSTTYLRGFSHFLSTFYILKATRGFCKFSSPQFYILQSTKRSTFPLHNSTFHQETLGFSQHSYTPQPTISSPHTQIQEIK